MAGWHPLRALVLDNEPAVIDEYRWILCPGSAGDPGEARPWERLESELFGAALAHRRFPQIDLAAARDGWQAVELVRQAVSADQPFALAFLELGPAHAPSGLQTAERIRALDPDLHIVLVAARCDLHPVELSELVPPPDRLFFVSKPFHPGELQQLALALGARWRGERWLAGGGLRPGNGGASLSDMLERLPAAVVVYDRRDRFLAANERMARLFPQLADHLVPGSTYEQIQREMARRILPDAGEEEMEQWLAGRLDWHARAGAVVEQRLPGGGAALLLEGATGSGETYCLYLDVTELERRAAKRASAQRLAWMAGALGALLDRAETTAGKANGRRRRNGANGSSGGAAAADRPGPGAVLVPGPVASRLRTIAQRQELVPEPLVLNRLLSEIVPEVRAGLPATVEIEAIAGAGLWPVSIDRAAFAAALAELIRNACEAMAGSPVRVVLETANVRLTPEFAASRPGMDAGEWVRCSVRDTGPGMAPDLAARALDPFCTGMDGGEHLGLGLSAVYGFARQSGGHVEIETGQGRGTAVHLYFQRALAGAPARERRPEAAAAASGARLE